MAVRPSEHNYATDRTQPLPSMAGSDAIHAALQASAPPSSETADDRTVLICTFEAPASSLLGPDESPVTLSTSKASAGSDKVPHAVPSSEPLNQADSIQTQALELAANRAELARQERAQEELQRSVRLRDSWLQDLRSELKTVKDERQKVAAQLGEAQTRIEQMAQRIAQQDAQLATLQAEAAERMSLTAFASGESRRHEAAPTRRPEIEEPSLLKPLDHDASPIALNRKTMTVGRTRDCDICVPSALVSRDHARIFVRGGKVVLVDVGSINGCFVNDQMVRKHTLRDGDVLRFADLRYRYSARAET